MVTINVMAGRQHGVRPERYIMEFALICTFAFYFVAGMASVVSVSLVGLFIAEVV